MTRIGEISGMLKPSVPHIEVYGAFASASVVAWNDVLWAFNEFNTSDFELRSDGTILVYTTGIYIIDFELGVKLPNQSTNATVTIQILNNGNLVNGSQSIIKLLNAAGETNNYGQLYASKTVYLKAYDLVSFQFYTTSNTLILADNIGNGSSVYYSRARISYTPFGGYNNNACGSVVFRGIRR